MRSAACYAEGGAERAVRSDWNWTAAPQVGGGRQVQLQHGPYGAQPAQPMYTQYPGNGSGGPADAPTLQSQPMMAGPVFGGMAHREARDLSPRERRKRSHNAVHDESCGTSLTPTPAHATDAPRLAPRLSAGKHVRVRGRCR